MLQDANEYEARAAECERLALATADLVLREEIRGLVASTGTTPSICVAGATRTSPLGPRRWLADLA